MSAIEHLCGEFAKLPGIGRKTASRLTYFLLRQPRDEIRKFAESLVAVAEKVKTCGECGNLTEEDRCVFCSDPRRDDSSICVVEHASDIEAIERSGEFRGRYHVLGGHISPLDGIGPEDLAVAPLLERVGDGATVNEVIVATNPSMEGEATATYLMNVLATTKARVTRIALGLPVGGDLQYADGSTIAQALAARRDMHL